MNRRGRASQVINLIDFQKDWFDNIMTNKFEVGIIEQVNDVSAASGKKVVETQDVVSVFE
jgi:hypothetical protein